MYIDKVLVDNYTIYHMSVVIALTVGKLVFWTLRIRFLLDD
jgi:hypothetical protein